MACWNSFTKKIECISFCQSSVFLFRFLVVHTSCPWLWLIFMLSAWSQSILGFLCWFVGSCLYVFVVREVYQCVYCRFSFLFSSDHKSTFFVIDLLRASLKWLLHRSIQVNRSGSTIFLSNKFHSQQIVLWYFLLSQW